MPLHPLWTFVASYRVTFTYSPIKYYKVYAVRKYAAKKSNSAVTAAQIAIYTLGSRCTVYFFFGISN